MARMKRKILSVIICVCLLLVACSEKEQAAETQVSETTISECSVEETTMSEVAVSEATEVTDTAADVTAVLRTISMDEVLLTCKILEDETKSPDDYDLTIRDISNERLCIILRNGDVYCANLYANSISNRDECAFLTNEMLPYLQDVRFLGKVSDGELEMIRGYVDQSDLNNTTYAAWTGCPPNFSKTSVTYNKDVILIIYGYLAIYREDEKAAIWRQACEEPIYTGKSDAMEYLDNSYSTKIIYWFLESSFYQKWGEYTLNTGTNKNPILDSTYITSFPVSMKDVYPDNEIFKIATEEELEYAELNMGIGKDVFIALYGDEFWQGMQRVSEDYPLDEYDYIIKISSWDNWRQTPNPNWKQHANALRHNENYLYFYYDTYSRINYTDRVEDEIWIAGMEAPERWGYVDIAVVEKDSIEKEGLPELQRPQEIEIFAIEDPNEKYIIVE